MDQKKKDRIYTMKFGSVYPLYIAKAERKDRTKQEVDEIISWLTGYTTKEIQGQVKKESTFQEFFAKAPKMNPLRKNISGVVCGVKVQDIKDPLMQEIRYLDKLIDELARGKKMTSILRTD